MSYTPFPPQYEIELTESLPSQTIVVAVDYWNRVIAARDSTLKMEVTPVTDLRMSGTANPRKKRSHLANISFGQWVRGRVL